MFFYNNNKIVPISSEKNKIITLSENTTNINNKIKISYNDENCFYCNLKDMIIYGSKNLSYCKRCEKDVLIFEYMSKDEYKSIIEDKKYDIKKKNFDVFLKSADI